jgi:hypothetical protein
MPVGVSPWRVTDVVAYDRMQASARLAFGLLHVVVRAGGSTADTARGELAELRTATLDIDPYDRAAVSALRARLETRIRELRERAS